MARKTGLGFAAALALVTAIAAAGAQAATVPRWFIGWREVPEPAQVATARGDKIRLHLQDGSTAICRVSAQGTVIDPPEAAGIGEVTSFAVSRCGVPKPREPRSGCDLLQVYATGLPWRWHLAIAGPYIEDVIEGVQLEIRCALAQNYGTYTGRLTPFVNDQEGQLPQCRCCRRKPCAQLGFNEHLSNSGGFADISGVDKIEGLEGTKAIEAKLVTY